MDNIKTTALYQNIQNDIIKQLGEGCLTDMVLDVVMPMFEPFVEERLSNFELYREAKKVNRSIVTNWKPSEQQIKALWKLMKYAVSLSSYYGIQKEIESLYEDLVTLKGDVIPMKEIEE